MGWFNKLINTFRKKESKIASILVAPGSGDTIYPERNYETYAKEAYLKNVISYRCVDITAKSIASVPWGLFRKNSDGEVIEIDNHPVLKIFKRANPEESGNFVIMKGASYLVMGGDAYFERVSPKSGPNVGLPKELYSHRPDRMVINVDSDTGKLSGYTYTVEGRSTTWEVDQITGRCDILHLKLFHPLNDWYGGTPTESTGREIDTYNEATDWNKNLVQNEARPGLMFMYEGHLSQEQFDRLESQLKDSYGGGKNAGKSMILEGLSGGKSSVQPYGWSPKDLDYIASNQDLSRKIAYGYGVPSMLVGIPGDNTYANYKEARLAFWEDTVIPHLNYFRDEFNNWFFGTDDQIYLDYKLEDIPALATKREATWQKLQQADFLTINEKREMVGLEAIEGGDVLHVPATMIPLGEDFGETDQDAEEEDEKAIAELMRDGHPIDEALEMIGQ